MNLKDQGNLEIFVLALVAVSLLGILLSEYGPYQLTSTIEAIATVGLTAALLVLYGRQGDILEGQVDMMEDQNRMFQQEYTPDLFFDYRNSEYDGDIVKMSVRNRGAGLALDIGLETSIEHDGESYTAFCPPVRKESQTKSPGILDAFNEEEMEFEIRLPDPNSTGDEPTTAPYSVVLEEFDFEPGERLGFQIAEKYKDARREEQVGSIKYDDRIDLRDYPTVQDLAFF